MIGNSNDKTNFPHELLLTKKQVANLRKAFSCNSPTDIKLSKTQLSKIMQSGGFLGRLLGPLLKTGLPLIKNIIKPWAKNILITLRLTAAASAGEAGIHKKILGSGHNTTTLIIKNDELKEVSETVQNEAKEQKERFLSMLLGTLGASLLGNILAG